MDAEQHGADGAVRRRLEEREHMLLSVYAAFADQSLGRAQPIAPCPIRTAFQRDRDRLIHCKSFRRLKHKTQVFLSPDGDHYRTRLTHTLEVAQIARTVSRAIGLNEDLTEAIALGHDLGHTPFGHAGERALTEISGLPFFHNENSLRIVEVLENNGRGLNLTAEVRNGILCHSGPRRADTFEGAVVAKADRIAYISHDIDDAIRAGVLQRNALPAAHLAVLGETPGAWINTMVLDMVAHSGETDSGFRVSLSPRVDAAMNGMRDYLFDHVYTNPVAKSEETKARLILEELYRHFEKRVEEIPGSYQELLAGASLARVICDYLSSMTDRYAVEIFKQIYIPKSWHVY